MEALEFELSSLSSILDNETPRILSQFEHWKTLQFVADLYDLDIASIPRPSETMSTHVLDKAKVLLSKNRFYTFKRAWKDLTDIQQAQMMRIILQNA